MSFFKKRNKFFYLFCFLFLLPSFYSNFWNIAKSDLEYASFPKELVELVGSYEPYTPMLVIGRLAESEANGLFTYAALPGLNFSKATTPDSLVQYMYDEKERHLIWYANTKNEYNNYFNNQLPGPDYCPYTSQIGGQIFVYSVINKVLPFGRKVNYNILLMINAILCSLVFVLFIAWCYRNYGFLPALITFILIALSSWIILIGMSLWWSLWGLYIPFIVSLYVFEKRDKGQVTDRKVVLWILLAIFLKCLFTGMEFITSSMMAIYSPVIYYAIKNREKIVSTIVLSCKMGIAALISVACSLIILLFQIQAVMGSFKEAWGYLVFAYVRRTTFDEVPEGVNLLAEVFKLYFLEDAFSWGGYRLPHTMCYVYLILGMLICSAVLYFFFYKKERDYKYPALIATFIFSILAPFSWFYIFDQHAFQHPCFDNIVWYMPFLLYGYLIIGVSCGCICKWIKAILQKNIR